MLFLNLHGQGLDVEAIFWGLWLFPLGLLAYRSGFIPRNSGYFLVVRMLRLRGDESCLLTRSSLRGFCFSCCSSAGGPWGRRDHRVALDQRWKGAVSGRSVYWSRGRSALIGALPLWLSNEEKCYCQGAVSRNAFLLLKYTLMLLLVKEKERGGQGT